MSKPKRKSIGTVIPLGDGATGKSLLTKHLIGYTKSEEQIKTLAQNIKKSLNVEIEFSTRTLELNDSITDTTIQYYVFPGQRQKISRKAPTFDEIVDIFNFLPALTNITVLLMLYDTTRLESLKSLEFWLKAALKRGWIAESTKIILVCTKIDLQKPNIPFVENIKKGIFEMLSSYNIEIDKIQITHVSISSITLEGIDELRSEIFNWVAFFGLQREVDS